MTEEPFFATVTSDGEKHPVTRGLPGSASTPPAWSPWFRDIDAEVVKGTPVMAGPAGKPCWCCRARRRGAWA